MTSLPLPRPDPLRVFRRKIVHRIYYDSVHTEWNSQWHSLWELFHCDLRTGCLFLLPLKTKTRSATLSLDYMGWVDFVSFRYVVAKSFETRNPFLPVTEDSLLFGYSLNTLVGRATELTKDRTLVPVVGSMVDRWGTQLLCNDSQVFPLGSPVSNVLGHGLSSRVMSPSISLSRLHPLRTSEVDSETTVSAHSSGLRSFLGSLSWSSLSQKPVLTVDQGGWSGFLKF